MQTSHKSTPYGVACHYSSSNSKGRGGSGNLYWLHLLCGKHH